VAATRREHLKNAAVRVDAWTELDEIRKVDNDSAAHARAASVLAAQVAAGSFDVEDREQG
jgi:hypothetical protein